MPRESKGLLGVSACVLAAAALAACGGAGKPANSSGHAAGGGGGSSTPASSASTTSTSSASTTPAGSAPVAPSSAAPTAAGTTLKAGQPAVVNFDTTTASGNDGPSYKLQVTVQSITAGSMSDFKGISISGVPKGASPTYVRLKMSNISGKSFGTSNLDPANAVQAVEGNNLDSSVIISGYFAACPNTSTPDPFKAGETFTTCETYLEKGEATKIGYNGSSATLDSPIVWSP